MCFFKLSGPIAIYLFDPIETSLINNCDDIGFLLRSIPQNRIRSLPSTYKYLLFSSHFKPSSTSKFPSRYSDGCNRACQHKYLEENPSFVYSKAEDGIFCLPCVLFATKDNLGQFVCNLWSKQSIKFVTHNSKQYHSIALSRMDALKSSMVHPESFIENSIQQISEILLVTGLFLSVLLRPYFFVEGSVSHFVVIGMIALLAVTAIGATF